MSILKKTLVCFILAGLTVGCNDTTNTEKTEVVESGMNQSVETANTNPTVEPTYPSYSDVPTDRYLDVFSKNFSYLRAMIAANNAMELTTDEKLNAMFSEYRLEEDLFKKQDLAKELTPKLEAEIDKYKSPIGIKVPLGQIRDSNHPYQKVIAILDAETDEEIGYGSLADIQILDYNFDTQSFPIMSCDHKGAFQILDTNQNIIRGPENLTVRVGTKGPSTEEKNAHGSSVETAECGLLVEDRDLAQKIQNLMPFDLGVSGWAYYVIDDELKDPSAVYANPVRVDIGLFNKKNGEELLKSQLNW